MSWRFCRSTQRLRRIGAVESIKGTVGDIYTDIIGCVIVFDRTPPLVVTETLRSGC